MNNKIIFLGLLIVPVIVLILGIVTCKGQEEGGSACLYSSTNDGGLYFTLCQELCEAQGWEQGICYITDSLVLQCSCNGGRGANGTSLDEIKLSGCPSTCKTTCTRCGYNDYECGPLYNGLGEPEGGWCRCLNLYDDEEE